MPESTQHKLDRVRKPRVHITYDVQVGDAKEKKELPFVIGVMADLSGKPVEALPKLKDRKFVEINPDNFDTVLEKMKPHLSFSVRDRLSEDPLSLEVAAAEDPNAPRLKVNIDFNSLQDFEPDRVAEKVPPLKQLLDLRRSLTDLKGSLQGNDKLEELLQAAITETEQRVKLRAELNLPEEPAK